MTTTLNLVAKQISDVVFVPPGSRITSDGGGTIEWMPGSPTDTLNSPKWTVWAHGSLSGHMDTTRPMSIRAVATADMTVTIEYGVNDQYGGLNDKYADPAYFEESTPRLSTDAYGNTSLVGAGGASFAVNGQGGADPVRMFFLGDSLTMRQFRFITGASVVVSGTDVTVTSSDHLIVAGSYFRVINKSDSDLNIDVLVASAATNEFTLRYPFDVSAKWSGTCTGAIYCQCNDTGFPNYIAALLAAQGKPISIVRNAGDGGDTIAQCLARIETEIAPYIRHGDIVVDMCGINDVEVTTTANMIAGKKAIFDRLLALGATVHAGTITQAQSSAYFTSAATALAQIAEVNGYIRARCKTETRMKCFDGHAALGGGDYASAGSCEADGVHYLPAGAQLVAARYVTDCGDDIRKGTFFRWLSTNDNYADATSTNLLTNCQFAGATGATPPTDWTMTGAGTNTWALSAHPEGIGSDLSLSKSHTAVNATTLTQDISARVSGGDRLIFGTEYETVTVGEGHFFRAAIEIVVGGVTMRHELGRHQFTYAQGGRLPTAGTRYAFENVGDYNTGRSGVIVPEGFTSVKYTYTFQLGASGSFGAKVARPYVYKV